MRSKILSAAVSMAIGSALTVLLTSTAMVGAQGPILNGDCNGDESRNVSDAVYLLRYLFTDGPEPVAISGGGSLSATGQTTCYMGVEPWSETDCGSAEYPGQDGLYQKGCPMDGRFVDNGDGTVTDTCTGLTWQQETAPGEYNWAEALRYCEDLDFAGHDDWRLPNLRELESIVDYGRYDPAIDPVFSAESSWYWSSSSDVVGTDLAWIVVFNGGFVYRDGKLFRGYVRAVRG